MSRILFWGSDSLATLMGASDLFHRLHVAIHDRVMWRHGWWFGKAVLSMGTGLLIIVKEPCANAQVCIDSCKLVASGMFPEHPHGIDGHWLCLCRTEAPQQVSTDDILWLMEAMQIREVGKLVAYLWKMRWLHWIVLSGSQVL